ncbi:SGNH/GDSL hydrolase family protein [Dendronalium sp. ChiSLP03b]|uniref:SGNH/GDSL hydrolase family protein n=1 Tax=Dendronalium sp. ChiSLP03b TaxID=3075381 RepID=UPI002AD38717|nr:SGNH/GDSL hydrolase family protein [Dendronalium sp. ChiSLP03b]MDZ8203258.1 SGNH/GDSL hydrolase family protein [Dendronalium sp. ChiSLP03b]
MRDPYLLAASLLTGLVLPTSALPQVSIILPESSKFLSNLQHNSQPTISENNILSFDISLPEFSRQALPLADASQPTLSQKSIPSLDSSLPHFSNQVLSAPTESSLNPSYQPHTLPLTSGNQLYYQRLVTLKTDKIYTHVDTVRVQSLLESAKKPQLTYEDWKSLLALEAKAITQIQDGNHLSILVGDSLSMWFPAEKLPAGKLWLNQGISGDTSGGIFKRLAAFSATRPEAIYIMAGINDLRKGASDETILRNHRRIIRSLKQSHPKTQIIIQSILPTRLESIPNSRIRRINAQLASIAKQEKVSYVNIYSWFIDFQGNLRSELTTDGLHLSPDGYDVWRSALQQLEFQLTQREN